MASLPLPLPLPGGESWFDEKKPEAEQRAAKRAIRRIRLLARPPVLTHVTTTSGMIARANLAKHLKRSFTDICETNEEEKEYQEDDTSSSSSPLKKKKKSREEAAGRKNVRSALFRAIKKLQSEVDHGTLRCPKQAVNSLYMELAAFKFTRWSNTLAHYNLSLPLNLAVAATSSAAASSSSQEFEDVRYELILEKHEAQTVFICVPTSQDVTISFTMRINAHGAYRSPNNLYLSAQNYTVLAPDATDDSLNNLCQPMVRVSQWKDQKQVPLTCAVGGEVRHTKMPTTTTTTSSADRPYETCWRVTSTQRRGDCGRPLKCNLNPVVGHKIRFDIRRLKGFSPKPPIWACTKVKKYSDSRIITPNHSISFVAVEQNL